MKKIFSLLVLLTIIASCEKEESKLVFNDTSIIKEDGADIEVNYPIFSGKEEVAAKINEWIETSIAMEISLSDELQDENLNDAIESFNKEFILFKREFDDTNQIWEALVDSEVLYQSPEIITVSVSTYIDTGGAHGNTHVIFLNFNPETGESITKEDIIKDEAAFTELAIKHFKSALDMKKHDLEIVDSFYGKNFELPETIGFSEEGVVILYNTYEIAAYSFGITEYTIPFEEVSNHLNMH